MTDKAVGVRLSADISGYVSAMGQASAATRQVSSEAQAAGKKASGAFGAGGLASAARAGATALTATAAAAGALGVAAFKGGVSYNALQQSSRAALTTILKGSQAANAQMDKLDAFAKNSPFAKQVFISAQQQLLGFGLEAEKVIPALDAIQNSVAAVGGSNEDIGNVTDALAKMLGQGKLAGDTLNRLGMYGIDAASIIGESMGKTGVEIREMASKPGGIPAGEVWDALINGLDSKFGGAAANVKKTWTGATDRIKGAWRDIGSALAEPFVGHKGGGLAIEWVNKFADLLRAIEKQVGPIVSALLPKFSGAFNGITPLLERATAAVKGMDPTKLADGLGKISRVAPGIAAVASSILAMGGNSLGLSRLGLSLNPLVAGLVALVAASPEGRKALADLLGALSPLVPVVADLSGLLAGSLTVGVQSVAAAVQLALPVVSLLASGVTLLSDGFKALPGPVQGIVGALAAARVAMALLGTETGQRVTKPLRDMASSFTDTSGSLRGNIGAWNDLTRELRQANPALGGVQARIEALSTSSGLLGRMSDSFMNAAVQAKRFPNAAGAAAAAMTGLKGAASGLLTALGGPWGIALGAATTGLMAWANANAEAKSRAESLMATMDEQTGKFTELSKTSIVKAMLGDLSAADVTLLQSLGVNFGDVADKIIEGGDAARQARVFIGQLSEEGYRQGGILSQQGRAAEGMGRSFDRMKDAADDARVRQEALTSAVQKGADGTATAASRQAGLEIGLKQTTTAVEEQIAPTDSLAQLLYSLGAKSKETTDYLKSLKGAMDLLGGGARAVEAAQDALAASIDKAKEAAKAKASKTKSAAEVERDYRAALRGVADATSDAIQKQMDAAASQKDLTATYDKGRAALEKQLRARGLHGAALKTEADRIMGTRADFKLLLEEYAKTPKEKKTDVKATGTAAAKSAIDTVKQAANALPRTVSIMLNVSSNVNAAVANVRASIASIGASIVKGTKRATGGPVFGAGTATSDSIPAWLSNGEFVIRTAAAQAIGYDRLHWMNQRGTMPAFKDGGRVGFASGGLASLSSVDRNAIMALIAAISNPIRDLSNATKALTAAQSAAKAPAAAKAKEDRDVAAAKRRADTDASALARAKSTKTALSDEKKALQNRISVLSKQAAAIRGVTKADRDLAAARRQLDALNAKIARQDKAVRAAQDKASRSAAELKKQQDQQKVAADRLRDAQEKVTEAAKALADQQKAVADAASRASDSFRGQFDKIVAAYDPKFWAQNMRWGAGQVVEFNQQVDALRKAGLSETLVQQIIAQGVRAGSAVASSILSDKSVVGDLNKASKSLQSAADALGMSTALGIGRYAGGGAVGGRYGVDKNLAWLTRGEHVLDTDDVAAMGGHAQVYAFRKALHGDWSRLRAVSPSLMTPRQAQAPSLAGLAITGVLDTPFGPAQVRGVVQDELQGVASTATHLRRQTYGLAAGRG